MSFKDTISNAGSAVGHAFQTAGKVLFGWIKKTVSDNEEPILEAMKELAVPIIEIVEHADLDGDGRIAAANEILDVVEKTGLLLGKALAKVGREDLFTKLSQHYTEQDLKRYIAGARLIMAVIAKYGPQMLPKASPVINGIIEAVLA